MLTNVVDNVQDETVVTHSVGGAGLGWVLLAYRVPREPSTPRIAIWRRLKKLGVAQVVDGLVALPEDARTREALEWVADEVLEAGGTATVWHAKLGSKAAERNLIARMATARTQEYEALTAKASTALAAPAPSQPEGMRRLRLLRRELRTIQRRDFFPPPARHETQTALKALAERYTQPGPSATTKVGAP
jgi:hypothetical protein